MRAVPLSGPIAGRSAGISVRKGNAGKKGNLRRKCRARTQPSGGRTEPGSGPAARYWCHGCPSHVFRTTPDRLGNGAGYEPSIRHRTARPATSVSPTAYPSSTTCPVLSFPRAETAPASGADRVEGDRAGAAGRGGRAPASQVM
jgi:hypothetical protein